MIPFPTRIILDGEIIPIYATTTHPNKAIQADSSIHMDVSPNKIIKQDNPLHSQTPMLWGRHPMMIFVRWWKLWLLILFTLQQNVMSFQQETRSSIHNLEKQMGQVASSVGKLEAQINGKLPSQALNPKEHVSAIMLWSGKELEEKTLKIIEMEEEEEIETELSTKKENSPPPQT